ncbi:MAG: chromosomal replication initiator protein DnaA, partial [Proteobacteria bacterium]|nr:chromosomal replication initiator protein DnaA [Pseudomonadota bacterium]
TFKVRIFGVGAMEEIWAKAKASIREKLTSDTFNLWIKPLEFKEMKEGQVVLECPNVFFKEWVNRYYLGTVQDAFQAVADDECHIYLKAAPKRSHSPAPHNGNGQMVLPKMTTGSLGGIRLNKRFTFERFVVGPCNQFAHSAAWAVSNKIGIQYNPLFFYSDVGLGKSHLSTAIGNYMLKKWPETRISLVSAEEFVNELVTALRRDEIASFKEKYRKYSDILVIDGVHFFSGKPTTQAELSHTLDTLYNCGKQIILTSIVPPEDIPKMGEGLKSRLGCGLVVRLQSPKPETRRRILEAKALAEGVRLPDPVLDYLASRLNGNIRQLEGTIIGIIAQSSLLHRPIDLDLARESLRNVVKEEGRIITIELVQEVVGRYYRIDIERIKSKSKRRDVYFPRQVAMFLCRKLTSESLEAIGKAFNKKHASVIYSIANMERKARDDPRIARQIEFLIEKTKGG